MEKNTDTEDPEDDDEEFDLDIIDTSSHRKNKKNETKNDLVELGNVEIIEDTAGYSSPSSSWDDGILLLDEDRVHEEIEKEVGEPETKDEVYEKSSEGALPPLYFQLLRPSLSKEEKGAFAATLLASCFLMAGIFFPIYVMHMSSSFEGDTLYSLDQEVTLNGVRWVYTNSTGHSFSEFRPHLPEQYTRGAVTVWWFLSVAGAVFSFLYSLFILKGPAITWGTVKTKLSNLSLPTGGMDSQKRVIFIFLTAAAVLFPYLSMLYPIVALPGAFSLDQHIKESSTRDILNGTCSIGKGDATPTRNFFGELRCEDTTEYSETEFPQITEQWGGGTGWYLSLIGAVLATGGVLLVWRWLDIRFSAVLVTCPVCEKDIRINVLIQDMERTVCPFCGTVGYVSDDKGEDSEDPA